MSLHASRPRASFPAARRTAARVVAALLSATFPLLVPNATARAERASPDHAAVREGRLHFRRGLVLFDEGDLGGAHVELQRAYELAPSFKILYDLGQISLRRQDWVSAARELGAYLSEGGTAIAAGRRKEVAETLSHLPERTATVEITAGKEGARLIVDDAPELPLPLAVPLTLNVGHHVVTVVWPTGERETKALELASGDRTSLHFAAPAEPLPATDEGWATRPPGSNPANLVLPLDDSPTSLLAREDSPTTRPSAGHHSSAAWSSWSATALLAAATGVSGVLALRASRTLAADRASYPVGAATLAEDATRARHYAIASDALGAATLALTGLSLYVTLR